MMKETASKSSKGASKGANSSTLAGLLQEDYSSSDDSYFIDNAWRGAEVRPGLHYLEIKFWNNVYLATVNHFVDKRTLSC